MKKVILPISAVLVMMFSLSNYVHAGSRHHGGFGMAGGRMAEALALTDQQREDIRRIRGQLKANKIEFNAPQDHKNLFALDPSAADYSDQVATMVNEKAEMMKSRMLARANAHREIYQLLTPEQQTKYLSIKQDISKKKKRRQERQKREYLDRVN